MPKEKPSPGASIVPTSSRVNTAEAVVQLVQRVANDIPDPCGLAQGVTIGLVDMGLIRKVDVQPVDEGWDVAIRIRLTTPGCFYFLYFEREIRRRLAASGHIKSLHIEWDPEFDWTPDDLSETARLQLAQRRRMLLAARR